MERRQERRQVDTLVLEVRASFLPEIYLSSIYLYLSDARKVWAAARRAASRRAASARDQHSRSGQPAAPLVGL